MKKPVAILGWALCALLVIGALTCGSVPAAILFLVAAVLVCPLFRMKAKLPGKIWIPAAVVIFLVGCFLMPQSEQASDPAPAQTQEDAEPTGDASPSPVAEAEPSADPDPAITDEPEVSDPVEPEPEETQAVGESMEGISVVFYDSVVNDVTGRWRLALVSDGLDMEKYAVSYYQTYFESDAEIHFVVDFTRNTTTKITYVLGSLSVDVYDHADGEEHDAKVMPSGTKLASYLVDVATGEIEEVE